jgi:hypothetical protein
MCFTVSNYLNFTCPIVRAKITREVDTPLFSVKTSNYRVTFVYEYYMFPSLYILGIIQDNYYDFVADSDGYIETRGIPLRWFYILRDYFNAAEDITATNMDHSGAVNQFADPLMLGRAWVKGSTRMRFTLKVYSAPNGEEWYTKDGEFSPATKKVLQACNQAYSSTYATRYCELFVSEGGIMFVGPHVQKWIQTRLSCGITDEPRPECKCAGGSVSTYTTSSDITPEELLVLYLSLKTRGCKVDFF